MVGTCLLQSISHLEERKYYPGNCELLNMQMWAVVPFSVPKFSSLHCTCFFHVCRCWLIEASSPTHWEETHRLLSLLGSEAERVYAGSNNAGCVCNVVCVMRCVCERYGVCVCVNACVKVQKKKLMRLWMDPSVPCPFWMSGTLSLLL